jgi:eukaryotic-like serine/threonine-protein kinase
MGSNLERGALLHKRYRIVEILGQGGMGSVYRAVDENLGVDVAVKENLFSSDEYARQFRLEAVLLANLRHPHLPRVTDHFVIDNHGQYLIMDYIEGEDLRQRMERLGFISEEEALLIGVAMCDALQYLHTRKPSVIHRDVKPGNVRIAPDGHIYLVDFGLAKLVKGSQATTTGARAMTPGYSPPEQYGTARTDPRTDIYSLGATLYAALTGVIPEDGLARAMDNIELTPLRKRNANISRKLASAIEKAMAVRPEDRFQTADEYKQALVSTNIKTQRLEGDLLLDPPPLPGTAVEGAKHDRDVPPADDEPPKPHQPSQPPLKPPRQPRRWLSGVLTFIALVAAVLAILYFWTPISRSLLALLVTPTPPTGGTAVAFNSPVAPPVQDPASTSLNLTPAQTATLNLVTSTPKFTATPDGPFLPSMTPTFTASRAPTATLTGGGYSQIAFASVQTSTPQIFLINSDGNGQIRLTNMPEGACQPDWSPDGAHIIFISPCLGRQDEYPGSKLYVIKADGSELLALPYSAEGDFDPAWSPDGKSIAFTSLRSGSAQIYTMTLPDYTVTQLTDASADKRYPDWSRQPSWAPDGTQIVYTAHSILTDAQQIWVMSFSGHGQTLLVPRGPSYWDFYADWSPDGKSILFNESSGPQAIGWLMVFDYENRATPKANHLRSGTVANHGSYSADGLWVVYESVDIADPNNKDYDIYIMKNESGNAPMRIETDASLNFDPAWRPVMP